MRGRPRCDADAELSCALLDRVGEHAEHAHDSQRERQSREHTQEHGAEARAGCGFPADAFERPDFRHRPLLVDARNRGANRRDQRRRRVLWAARRATAASRDLRQSVLFHNSAEVFQPCPCYKLDPVIDPAALQMVLAC